MDDVALELKRLFGGSILLIIIGIICWGSGIILCKVLPGMCSAVGSAVYLFVPTFLFIAYVLGSIFVYSGD